MAREKGPLSGFRDTLPEQMIPRQRMIQSIKGVYEGYGFTPLDTPAVERQETLAGKYGEEGEKLMYKFTDHGGRQIALRYDLTVPLARVVGQHASDLILPYKRYQVGNVWRGESPQAGRYREFMQFDADSVGAKSAVADAEIVTMMADAMSALGANSTIRVNNRRILDALVIKADIKEETDARLLISSIDKAEKTGEREAIAQISGRLGERRALLIEEYLGAQGESHIKLNKIEKLLKGADGAEEGAANLREVFRLANGAGYGSEQIIFDQRIARGLDYYTGIIYETNLNDMPQLGSVCSGGRYDNLVKALGGPDLPAVGTSIGVDRLFAGLQSLGKVESKKSTAEVMIVNFNQEDAGVYMQIARSLRRNGIPTQVYSDKVKIGKQLGYADKQNIPNVVLAGPDELEKGMIKIRNMQTGIESEVKPGDLSSFLQKKN